MRFAAVKFSDAEETVISGLAAPFDGPFEGGKDLDGDYDPECEEMNHQVVPLDEALGLVDDEHPNGTRAILPIVSFADIGAGSAAEAASAEAEAESA